MSGSIAPVVATAGAAETTTLALDLDPYDALFLIFSKRVLPQPLETRLPPGSPVDLSTGWRVSFSPGEPSAVMDRLKSWTDEPATRYFSGTAVYEREVTVPDARLQPGLTVRLDYGAGQPLPEIPSRSSGMQTWLDGPVREAAVVYVNDKRAGSVWCPPFAVGVTGLLKRGENKIRILVANTAINHMAGRSLPDYRLLNLRYGSRFDPQDMDKVQPVLSGLLGTIQLIPGTAGLGRDK